MRLFALFGGSWPSPKQQQQRRYEPEPDPEPYFIPPQHRNHHHHHADHADHNTPVAAPKTTQQQVQQQNAGPGFFGPGFGALTHLLLLPAAAGAAAAYALLGTGDPAGLALGAAAGLACRWVLRLLAETVPFTQRRHSMLLPVPLELAMGEASYRSFLEQQRAAGKLLSRRSEDHRLVAGVADRIIATAMRGHGGGSQSHLKGFKWEVVTVEDDTANAFVLPGGKVVVYTGLIRLLRRDPHLLATVLGHEAAHALARHGAEKISIGIFAAVAMRLLLAAAARASAGGEPPSRQDQRQQQQQQQRGHGRMHGYGYGASRLQGSASSGEDDDDDEEDGSGGGGVAAAPLQGHGDAPEGAARAYARQAASGAVPARGRGSGGGGSMSGLLLEAPEALSIANALMLQLPFSRRAESEADLIGLKLMALAGYDPRRAPDTFRRLGEAEHARGGLSGVLAALSPTAAKASALGCTHPRSARRVAALEEEVRRMVEAGPEAYERVFTPLSYWSL